MSADPTRIAELLGFGDAERSLPSELANCDASLLDVVDHLIDKGCVLTGEVVLGLADIDLIYIELSLLICSVDRLRSSSGTK